MTIKKFHIYLADLTPRFGTEPEKTRPVVVMQSNMLNHALLSTVVCPITTNVRKDINFLRVHLQKKGTGLEKRSDILVDQIRSIDNKRFIKHLGKITTTQQRELVERLQLVLFDEVIVN